MIKEIVDFLKDKRIAILGFGLEGKSTYNFIRNYLPNKQVDILFKTNNKEDLKDETENKARNDEFCRFIVGENYLENLENYDLIIKTPGISFKDIDISKIEDKITSELELFLEYTNSLVIGVTGTKGKSTTSSLIYKVISDQRENVKLLGNIGIPIFDEIENINENTIIVLELSSHALQYVKKSPNIAILLNLYEEHLDHYKSFKEYGDAKFNIFKFQTENDVAIFNLDNPEMNNKNYKFRAKDYAITMQNNKNSKTENTIYLKDESVFLNDKNLYDIKIKRNLKGNHNLNNIMFVLAVSNILNLDISKTINSISEFKPLENRLEYVGNFKGIDYYNDSIATIPESTIESIKALENVNTLLVGGNDRGVNLTNLIDFLNKSKIENIICLPKTGEYIYEGLIKKNKNVVKVENLEEAVNIAKKVTKKNTICLLSPAASSYGYFKNFKERGDLFKRLVKEN